MVEAAEARVSAEGTVHWLDHTADVGFEVRAATRSALFEAAVHGLAGLVIGADAQAAHEPGGPLHEDVVDIVEPVPDDEALLIAWLRELVFRMAITHRVPVRAEVLALDEGGVRARVTWSDAASAVREIKGVTWHGLVVRRTGDGWYGRVVFDV